MIFNAGYDVTNGEKLKNTNRTCTTKSRKSKILLNDIPQIEYSLYRAKETTENLQNETPQIIYYLYQAKEITKKHYNNIINSINVCNYTSEL